ncbi:DeoR/GlpR transcriptional regulator [Lichenicola cladoniae]|uniref:DeoR/GlpR transcriptional regulator n=1 Tax=Lichenicola cladoniae TaxID=1484109 RepID=A0A6M8HLL6_9PROT|nr:DeoR/GlpR family DNA-binding transcription regulator [Lichenicola cladoniae]NPD70390.1 DeoR/GlpR transcriptional regulator [Acetobacteraceae bacterium]QKE89230.1 DeoR/GlpR transcriptional regulator [Lichenicola cladoniae]
MAAFGAVNRQKEIVDRLRVDGKVSVAVLSDELGVSVVTIRNDLDVLERQQMLRRLRGGAIAVRPARFQRSLHPLHNAFEEEKTRIGELAASLVRDGETIIIDAGSTTLALARALSMALQDVAVVTPALDVALELERHMGVKVVITGGTFAKPQRCLISPFATTLLRQINADVAFVACSGVDAEKGFTTQSWEEAEVKHAIVAASSRVVFLADRGKIGHVATAKIMDIKDAELLITDSDADPATLRPLEHAGLNIILA